MGRWGSGPRFVLCSRDPGAAVLVPPDRQRLNALPKSAQPGAKGRAGRNLERREQARGHQSGACVRRRLRHQSGPRRSRRSPTTSTLCWSSTTTRPSTGSICGPRNPIESTFATVRLRQRVTKEPGSRAAGIAMAFQAHRVRSNPVACGQRTPPSRPRPRLRNVQQRCPGRTRRQPDRQTGRGVDSNTCMTLPVGWPHG